MGVIKARELGMIMGTKEKRGSVLREDTNMKRNQCDDESISNCRRQKMNQFSGGLKNHR